MFYHVAPDEPNHLFIMGHLYFWTLSSAELSEDMQKVMQKMKRICYKGQRVILSVVLNINRDWAEHGKKKPPVNT